MLKNCLRLWLPTLFFILSFSVAAQSETNQEPANESYRVALLKNDFIAQKQFEEIEKELNLQFTYQTYSEFTDVIRAITLGNADFAANIVYTERRDELFQISSPTNLIYMYLFTKDLAFEDVKSIAYTKGSLTGKVLLEAYPYLELHEYSTPKEALEMLNSGEVDAVTGSISLLDVMLENGFDATLFNSEVSVPPASLVASNKVHPQLLKDMETFLHTADMQRKIRETVEDYQYRIRRRIIAQLGRDLEIDLSKPLKIKLENRPAFAEYDENNEVKGIAADILDEVCQIIEANCQIVSNADESWDDMLHSLENNEIDVLAPVTTSDQRKEEFYLSKPFYRTSSVVVKRNDYKSNVYNELSELIVERIGVIKGEYTERILSNALPNKELIYYDNVQDEIQGLIDGEVDYIILYQIDYNQAITDSNNSLPIQVDEFFSRSFEVDGAFAFPRTKDGENLALLFNRALNIVDLDAIVAEYDISPNWSLIIQTQKKSETITYLFFICLFVIIGIFVYSQYRNAMIDELTKLKNRRALYRKYKAGLKQGVSLIYLDVNAFKPINDTYGHQIGDEVLVAFAHKVKQYWRGNAYRIGGDEFILVGQCNENEKMQLLENIARFVVKIPKKELEVHSSFGIYTADKKLVDLDEALHLADVEMYENKKKRYAKEGLDRRGS